MTTLNSSIQWTSSNGITTTSFVTEGFTSNYTNNENGVWPTESVNTNESHVDYDADYMPEMTTFMNDLNTTETSTYHMYSDHYDEGYIYGSYAFERVVYLYIWEVMVIVTCLVNCIVISILVRKKMRNATNIILAAIAMSDSLTGLVTLPTFIMVYQSLDDPASHDDYYHYYDDYPADGNVTSHYDHQDNYTYDAVEYDHMVGMDAYILSKGLCQWFMISRLFLSKSFHTMSIFLTLCLGIQRFVSSVSFFAAKSFTPLRALIMCIVVAVLSPLLHIFHLLHEKARYGVCEWTLEADGCHEGCIYLWVMFFIRQFLPCTVLIIFTILFIRQLMAGTKGTTARRLGENRRVAIVVTAIVIVFLMAEIPYGVFTLYNSIDKAANDGANIDIKRNRITHLIYEVLLVLSFHANFYIYTLLNRKFRKCLKNMILRPYKILTGDTRPVSAISSSTRSTLRRTELISMTSKYGSKKHSNSTSATDRSIGDSTGTV